MVSAESPTSATTRRTPRNKPVVVRSVFEGQQPTSGEISRVISERLEQGLGIYEIDEPTLRAAEPDLLITQAICEV